MLLAHLRASTDYSTMVEVSGNCFKELDLKFLKHSTVTLTEFEIVEPVYFRVVIEPVSVPSGRNLLCSFITLPRGVTIQIRLAADAGVVEMNTGKLKAYNFVRTLLDGRIGKPWVGIDGLARREEKKWRKFL